VPLLSSELCRGAAELLVECAREVAAAREPHLAGDAVDGHSTLSQQLGGTSEPDVSQVVHGSAPEALLEVPGKGRPAHVSDVSKLIERVSWIAEVAREALVILHGAGYEAELLAHYIPIVEKIISQAEQRVFQGVMLAADKKVYSLFEEHTELLKRGKAGKPIEFGHKVLIAQTGEKFIHHYQVFPKRQEDKELLEPTLKAHKQLFGTGPDVLATDKGFYENMKQIIKLEKDIVTVSICKKGRRNQQEYERESTDEFNDGQRFRAGCEGSISVLKRVFNLGRCLLKGFKNYAASVGCGIFCHNLVLLTRL